jgi:hypothetical protein
MKYSAERFTNVNTMPLGANFMEIETSVRVSKIGSVIACLEPSLKQ